MFHVELSSLVGFPRLNSPWNRMALARRRHLGPHATLLPHGPARTLEVQACQPPHAVRRLVTGASTVSRETLRSRAAPHDTVTSRATGEVPPTGARPTILSSARSIGLSHPLQCRVLAVQCRSVPRETTRRDSTDSQPPRREPTTTHRIGLCSEDRMPRLPEGRERHRTDKRSDSPIGAARRDSSFQRVGGAVHVPRETTYATRMTSAPGSGTSNGLEVR